MDIIKRQDNIGLVIVGEFDPTKLTPKWLYELNIITADEWNGQEKDLLVSAPITKYKFGPIEFLSQPSRIQLVSNDISQSNHLINMVTNILNCYGETKIKAVGVNAGLVFTFQSIKDSLHFGQYLSHLDVMKSFIDDPRLRTVTFENNREASADNPKTSIQIKAEDILEEHEIPSKDGKGTPEKIVLPVCTLQINNHFVVETKEQALHVVSMAENLHSDFKEQYTKFFHAI